MRTVKGAAALARDDLDTATSLLSVRHLAGIRALTDDLASQARTLWRKQAKWWLTVLGNSVEARHGRAGEVAFLLEPDLKDGRGGLRDVHALRWAEAAGLSIASDDVSGADARPTASCSRRESSCTAGPADAANTLVLQEQDAVAAALGDADSDALMARVASAGRAIAWISDDVWRRRVDHVARPALEAGGARSW